MQLPFHQQVIIVVVAAVPMFLVVSGILFAAWLIGKFAPVPEVKFDPPVDEPNSF